MEERIWVKIDGLQLHHLASGGPDRAVWASLKLKPAFNINGILIASCPNEAWQFTSNFGNADARLIDVPGLHEKPTKGELLRDVLYKAVHDACLDRAEVLRPFIKNGWPGDELTFGFFKPEDWQGKSLMIPVDFIRLQNFQSVVKTGGITADIQIGHHLIFFGLRVWTTFLATDLIFGDHNSPCGEVRIESRFSWLILSMLKLPEVQKVMTEVANRGIDVESKFIDKVEGCDPEATPPPIKFE